MLLADNDPLKGRPCEVTGHHTHYLARVHLFYVAHQSGGTPYALIEDAAGNVSRLDLSVYSVRFTDR